MTIAHSMAARGFRFANHRWLGKMRIGAWLFLGASLLLVLGNVLPLLEAWLGYTWGPYSSWLRRSLYWQGSSFLTACPEVLRIAAIWLLTAPEPGQERADSPRLSRRSARWLCIISYGASLALSVARKITPSSGYLIRSIPHPLSIAAGICLLIMMRRYAMRNADTKTAGRLEWAAILGGVSAIAAVTGDVLFRTVSPSSYDSVGISMALVGLVYWCAMMWAVGWFAVGVGRAVHGQRPRLRLGKTLVYVVAALVVGGIAGQLAWEVLYIQAQRVPESGFASMIMQMNWALWRVGVIVGVALLPNRIAMLHRMLTRWRTREGMGV